MTQQPPQEESSTVSVHPMTYGDTEQTADLYITHLPIGFFPQLGKVFVRRWLRTFIDSSSATSLVIRDGDGGVAAFLLATTDQHAYVRDVIHHDRLALAWRGATALLLRPGVGKRFLRTRAKRYADRLLMRGWGNGRHQAHATESGHQAAGPAACGSAPTRVGVVHAIVTHPSSRGAGYGSLLLGRYEAELARAGTSLAVLVTGAEGGAAGFYQRLKWHEAGREYDRDGREIVRFERVVGSC